jgi:molybdate transport system regulatory protein
MVDTMNKSFSEPLILTVKGGKNGGSSCLTELGEEVLKRFRKMEASSTKAIARDLAGLKLKLNLN